METRVNFTLVGLFVLLLGGAVVGTIAWLGSTADDKQYFLYRVYVRESVAGLNDNASVLYKGVNVGKVSYIGLDPDNPERVELRLQIEQGAPIRRGTLARLVSRGITGLVNLELSGGAGTEPLLPTEEQPVPVIRSAPSLVTQLQDAFQDFSRVKEELLNPDNLRTFNRILINIETITEQLAQSSSAIDRTLANLETFSRTLAANADTIDRVVNNASELLASGNRIGEQTPQLLSKLTAGAGALESMATDIARTSRELSATITATRSDLQREIQQLNRDTTPQLNRVLLELGRLSTEMRRLVEELERDPNVLLFGRPRAKPGPGE